MKPQDLDAIAWSPRMRMTALILSVVGGLIGLHRFYLGRYASGAFRLAITAYFWHSAESIAVARGWSAAFGWKCFLYSAAGFGLLHLFLAILGVGFLGARGSGGTMIAQRIGGAMLVGSLANYVLPSHGLAARRSAPLPRSAAQIAATAAMAMPLFFMLADALSRNRSVPVGSMALIFFGGLSGIMLTGDWILLYRNALTDSRGRTLQ